MAVFSTLVEHVIAVHTDLTEALLLLENWTNLKLAGSVSLVLIPHLLSVLPLLTSRV
jgi:hypothetical protein